MAQASREKAGLMTAVQGPLARGSREGALILAATLAVYLVLSLYSYESTDPGWSHSGPVERVSNQGGVVGAWVADVLLYLFGYLAYLFPVMVGVAGWLLYRGLRKAGPPDVYHWIVLGAGFLLTLAAGCGLATLHFRGNGLPLDAGGVLGNVVGGNLADALSPLGGTLFLLALFLTGATLFTGVSWLTVMDLTGRYTLRLLARGMNLRDSAEDWWKGRQARRARETQIVQVQEKKKGRTPVRIEPVVPRIEPSQRFEKERQVPLFETPPARGELPPVTLH